MKLDHEKVQAALKDNLGEDMIKNDEGLMPCRKCGELDYEMWDGFGTQAELSCNKCGQSEGVQVIDLIDYEARYMPGNEFNMENMCYPQSFVDKAKAHLIEEWNTRAAERAGQVEIDINNIFIGDTLFYRDGWQGEVTKICEKLYDGINFPVADKKLSQARIFCERDGCGGRYTTHRKDGVSHFEANYDIVKIVGANSLKIIADKGAENAG